MKTPQQSTAGAATNNSTSSTSLTLAKKSRPGDQVDPLDTLGLNGFARAIGVASDSVLAVTATLLSGIAGPAAWLQSPWGQTRLPKLDLLTSKEDFRTQRMIEAISAPLSLMNRRLAENMGRLSPDAIDLVTSGPFSTKAASKLADSEMRDKALHRHLEALTPVSRPGESGLLRQDLAFDPVTHRKESLLHPQFLLKDVGGRDLQSRVEGCHLRTALVIQPTLGLAREGPDPSRVMKLLCALLDGTGSKERAGSPDRGRDPSLPAKAHAILSLARNEVEAMSAMGTEHLNRFLWVPENVSQPSKAGDDDASEAFLGAFQAAVEEILELRREGRGLLIQFETREAVSTFEEELRLYEADIMQTASEAGPWERGLPQTLFWALAFLRRSLPVSGRVDDECLMTAAFSAARRLVEDHRNQTLLITNAQLLADRRALSERIVDEVSRATSPMKFRSIARCFRNQKKERISPVVEVLIETGVLVRDAAGLHTLGPVEFADAEEVLDKGFVQR